VSDMRCSILVQTRRTHAEPFDDVRMSFAPPGLVRNSAFTHGLRRGLHSCAAPRLYQLSKIL